MRDRAAGRRRSAAARSDSGMVSAELALAIPALVVVVLSLAWLLSLGVAQGTVAQSAREGARAAARGESSAEIRSAARRVAADVEVSVSTSGGWITVAVSARRVPPLPLLAPLGRELRAEATTWLESL